MKITNLNGHRTVKSFVAAKLARLDASDGSFSALFRLMFSERENILYERSQGYRIEKTTYGQAHDEILGLSATLKNLLPHVPKGSVVGIHMQNSLRWIELFWAVLRCGWRPLLMNLRLDDATLESALTDCKAAAVLSDGKVFSVPTFKCQDIMPSTEKTEEDFAEEILLMSSGTSQNLKICAYTAKELCHQLHSSYEIVCKSKQIQKHYKGQLKQLTFLPFYHVFGLFAVYFWFTFFSRTLVHLEDMAPQTILSTIRRHQVTHIFAVPLFWEKVYSQAMKTIRDRGQETYEKFRRGLALAGKLQDVPLLGALFRKVAFREVRENLFGESICFLITGGSFLSEDAIKFFNGIGYHLADGYGMTEIGITSVELSSKRKILNSLSVGKPLSAVEYKLDDNRQLLVRGKTLASYIMEGGTVQPKGQWFHTRDLAEEEGGHYRILGRSDDLVISPSGENLNPNLIEPLFSVPGTNGVCLVGIGDGSEKVPTLLVSVSPYLSREKLGRVEAAVGKIMDENRLTGQIGKLVFVTDPLLSEQEFKLNRRRLASDLAQGRLHTADPRSASEEASGDALMEGIRRIFAAAVGKDAEDIRPGADFFLDCGGSSLDYFAMVSQLQREFSVTMPADGDKGLHTVSALYEYIKVTMEHAD